MTCGRSVVSSTNRIVRHDITEILLEVALNTITPRCYFLFRYDSIIYNFRLAIVLLFAVIAMMLITWTGRIVSDGEVGRFRLVEI